MARARYRHIILDDRFRSRAEYRSHSVVIPRQAIPLRPREPHSLFLRQRLDEAWQTATTRQAVAHATRDGVYLEFRSDPGAVLITKSLDDLRSKKVRLLNVRTEVTEGEPPVTFATVYVANNKRQHFLAKIEAYADPAKDSPPTDRQPAKPANADLINSIADIRDALLVESFWTDKGAAIPGENPDFIEVWLSSDGNESEDVFRNLCARLEIPIEAGYVTFPERRVLVVQANRAQLELLSTHSDSIAEYRKAKETSAYWLDLENTEQAQWVRDLLGRLNVDAASEVAVCILDTGVTWGHPLLAPILSEVDCQAFDMAWGNADHHGHGTLMAGVAGYGDLREALMSQDAVSVPHLLESVKILPPGRSTNAKGLWGHVCAQSISLAELQAPERKRVICLAVTATDTRDQGRPSSWSGAIDKLSSGMDDDFQRLFVIAAGNLPDVAACIEYPDKQILESIHDPAQAWNALTVGAFTALARITDSKLHDYRPLAPAGGLSPFSSTSATWEDAWPMKPDVVFEGGNLAVDSQGFSDEPDDLCVISTFRDYNQRLLYGFNMTSAAAAQAAWTAAQIYSIYPDFWPETIRALMVHSAEWTPAMKEQFLPPNPSKKNYKRMIRLCGWGVPNLDRALHTAQNSLTLVTQAELQPFSREIGRIVTKDMHLHQLPWPTDALLDLPLDVDVRMRVTLSYFVQPGPGEIGWKDRYRYPSHQLRFAIIRPGETLSVFKSRISAAAESDEDSGDSAGDTDCWLLGSQARHRGSLHSDYWEGSASDLASSNCLAVFPKTGWWKERPYLGKVESRCRYSLAVSIFTPNEEIDLYTPVSQAVGIPIIALT